jgi:predicted Zn-dependent peptidase
MNDGPTDIEIKRAIEMIKSQWYFGMETYHEQASTVGYWHMQGRPDIIDTYIQKIEKVKKEDIQKFLKKYYTPQGLSQALMVPEAGQKK